jgi:DNA-directed RNA polymerase specialized sigma24 family protein
LDLADLEELASDTLLKFFKEIGHGRREGSIQLKQALLQIVPLDLGPFHRRQVTGWRTEVSSYWEETIRFRLPQMSDHSEGEGKTRISALTARIKPLQKQGCRILDTVRSRLAGNTDEDKPTDLFLTQIDEHISAILQFVHSLNKEIQAKTAYAMSIEEQYPGISKFFDRTGVVIETLPKLRVPTNGLLFTIAANKHVDRCRASGIVRRKNSSLRLLDTNEVADADATSAGSQHLLYRLGSDDLAEIDGEAHNNEWLTARISTSSAPGPEEVDADPGLQLQNAETESLGQELFDRFHAFLREPVEEAEEAYARAEATGRSAAERKRLESLTRKFERVVSVLEMLGEGHTQEKAAELLGLSRNQVKYVIELAKEAYERFASASVRSSPISANSGGECNVP